MNTERSAKTLGAAVPAIEPFVPSSTDETPRPRPEAGATPQMWCTIQVTPWKAR